MAPFIILLTVPIVIAPFTKNIKINRVHLKYLPLFLFFVMLTTLIMLRHKNVGNDTSNYYYYFEEFSRMDWNTLLNRPGDVGFRVINKVISLISNDPRFFIAATGFIVSAMLYPTYRRLCTDSSLTIVLFCSLSTFGMMFSGIRQMLAVGIGVIAYEFTRRKWLIPFIIAVVVAMTIHSSAFMLAFMYPLYYAKITRKWLFFVIPVMSVVFVFNKQVFAFLGMVLEQFTNYEAEQTNTGAYSMLILLVIFAVISYLLPGSEVLDQETNALRNFLLIALGVQMFAPLNYFAMRMNFFYLIFVPLLLPRIINNNTAEKYRQFGVVLRYVMLIFFFGYFLSVTNQGGGLHYSPYHFFWEYYYI